MLERCPCEGCVKQIRCGLEELACKPFAFFVNYGRTPEVDVREPTKEIFDKVFKEDDMEQIWEHIDEPNNS